MTCITDIFPPKSIIRSNTQRTANSLEAMFLCPERDINLFVIGVDLVKKWFQVGIHSFMGMALRCEQK